MKRIYASVLITNFNKEKFLKKTLNSCKNQNFKDKEVIIFDDCSTDNSLSVIKKFKNFKLIKNKKKKFKSPPLNQIYAISKLIKFSKGEIIFFLDSDDEFKKDKISEICKLFKKNKKLNFIQDTPIDSSTKKDFVEINIYDTDGNFLAQHTSDGTRNTNTEQLPVAYTHKDGTINLNLGDEARKLGFTQGKYITVTNILNSVILLYLKPYQEYIHQFQQF